MARKPLTIKRTSCGPLWKYVRSRSDWLDIKSGIFTEYGLSVLKGDAQRIASHVIAEAEGAGRELGLEPEDAEARALDYLRSIRDGEPQIGHGRY